jgi:ribosomal protein S8
MINKSGVLKKFKLKSNFLIATFVATLNMGLQRRLRSVRIVKTQVIIRLLRILYQNGIIRSYAIKNDIILVYFKYSNSNQICANFSIVSKPSKRAR